MLSSPKILLVKKKVPRYSGYKFSVSNKRVKLAGFALGWRVIIGEIGDILEILHFKFYFDFKLLSLLQLLAAWFVF